MKHQYDLCVVGGAGHIGLPFALVFAEKGLNVAIYDISQTALDTIGKGIVPFMEDGAEPLLKKVMAQGKILAPLPSLEQSRAAFLEEFGSLPDAMKSIRNPEHYSVEFSGALRELRDAVERKVAAAE